ncbi:MAG TPA: exopolysaccharide Pel transporter PelG, partial [Ktedonobacterales bacterium]|nr:exopolysaccharide Pel transporter PelG [Ktedonobacterales bacterium]
EAQEGMIAAVNAGLIALVKLQGLVSLFMCVVAPQVAGYLGLPSQWVSLLRVESIAAGAQFFTLVMLLLLLYLDRRRDALLVAATFLLGNFGLTLLTVRLGQQFYGWGYLVAAVVSALLGWILLRDRLKHIEFNTFMSQPL